MDFGLPNGIPDKVKNQLEYELKLIAELKYAPYFLTVWDIVQYAKRNDILCQGRGSAANSAVCYVLGITAVDPVWGFVVVNLGQKNSNIDAQSDLLVYRDGKFLGRLDIQSIEPTQTISDIDLKNLRPGQRIRPGDTVILASASGN